VEGGARRATIRLTIEPPARGRLPSGARARILRQCRRMVRAAALSDGSLGRAVEVGLTLTGDAEIHALNRDFRRKNRPTDVLAFAMREGEGGTLHPGLLGDVVISLDTAARQARRGLEAEVIFLWSHGLCHLLGYDHRTDREEAAMNARMKALAAEGARRGRTRPA
jgi:probable rRNA maturation factor